MFDIVKNVSEKEKIIIEIECLLGEEKGTC